jgi:hypothetical protein
MYIGGGLLGAIVLVLVILLLLGRILKRCALMATKIEPRPR